MTDWRRVAGMAGLMTVCGVVAFAGWTPGGLSEPSLQAHQPPQPPKSRPPESQPAESKTDDPYRAARESMVQAAKVAGVKDERVLDSLRNTLRHEFVDAPQRNLAYEDMALPIGAGQTISSPFIVAFMTASVDPKPADRVLEIGTGSGFQAAILSPLVKEVYTIEIVDRLGRKARATLKRLGYDNVQVKVGDGYQGWAEHAPFDKIVVTCSPEKPPQPLIDQLREGGLMVIPVGERFQQTLYLMRKRDGQLVQEALRPTLFVPMTGTAEDQRQLLPDASNPRLINGGFELPPQEDGFVRGWFYQRLASRQEDEQAPQGNHFVRLENSVPGRPSQLLQSFALDGRKTSRLKVAATVRYQRLQQGRAVEEQPVVAVSFFDAQRRFLGHEFLGPFRGSRDWDEISETFRVPVGTRAAMMRVGLFGATGRLDVDDVKIVAQ